MRIKLDDYGILPTRAHETDAGMDIYAERSGIIQPYGAMVFRTGVHVELPKNTVGILKSKSGLYCNHGISSTGVIDEGYSGEIVVRLQNHTEKAYEVSRGDKISQLLILPCFYPGIELADEIESGERGSDGFGSTGR